MSSGWELFIQQRIGEFLPGDRADGVELRVSAGGDGVLVCAGSVAAGVGGGNHIEFVVGCVSSAGERPVSAGGVRIADPGVVL